MFLLDYTFQLLALLIGGLWFLQTYHYYFRTNDTKDVNLLDLYCKSQMFRRYKSEQYEKT